MQNAESVDYELPLFLGGVDNQTYQSFKALGFTDSMKPQMTGCIKGVSFNNRAFEVPSEEVGTVPCSNATERGLFLGEKGGHSVLSYPDPIYTLKVDIAFKSRVTNGLLFSIGKVCQWPLYLFLSLYLNLYLCLYLSRSLISHLESYLQALRSLI